MSNSRNDYDNWEVYSKQHDCKLILVDMSKDLHPEIWQCADGGQVI